MRTNIKPENRRLLEALEYLDEGVISSVLAEVKAPESGTFEIGKRSLKKSLKYALALAACLVLMSAVVPAVSFIVERFGAGSSKAYELTYPMFVADLEPLSEEEMIKINEVYEDWKYDRLCERYGDIALADEYAKDQLGDDPHRFFNKERYRNYQYYGKFGDCVVLATENHLYTLTTTIVAGYKFELGGIADLIVYCDGEMMTLYEAYEGGLMTEAQVGAAHERYLAYRDYLDGYAETSAVDSDESSDNESNEITGELEIDIPEYIPPETTDEPFYWHFFGKQSEDEEAFTREEMLDIRKAYACYVFKNKYISVYKETMELWNSPDRAKERALDHAKAEADSAASRFFRNNHIAERCYGWTSERVILALLGKVDGESVFKVADNEMVFPCGTEMFVYENGEIFDFVEYRERGGFTFDEELEIAVKHWIYEGAIETVVNNAVKDVTYTKPTEVYDLESYFGAEFVNDEYIEPIAVLTKIDDCLVVHGKMGIGTMHLTYQVGAYKFDYPADFDLYVGYNGDLYDVSTAYKQGILDDFDVAKIYELYLDYCETEY